MEKTTLRNAFVAFLDVLGFKELINKPSKADEFFDIALINFKIIDNYKNDIFKLILSDSIILVVESENNKREHFEQMLKAIRNLQADLALQNIWIRGAISYGDVHLNKQIAETPTDEKIIYGDGYIRAYELEKNAVYPRVIIDPRLIPFVSNTRSEFIEKYSCLIKMSLDDNLVNKLPIERLEDDFIFAMPGDRNQPDDDLFISYGSKILYKQLIGGMEDYHIDFIYENLKKSMYQEHKHFPKYSWAKKYFWELMLATDHRLEISGNKFVQLQRQLDKFWKL